MTDYKCSIIANPEGNSWEFAKAVYKKLRKRNKKFELNEFNVKVFPDGEIKPKIKKNIRQKKCYFIHDSSLSPGEWYTQLSFVNDVMKSSSAFEINDVLPYLRFSRQDRKDESRVPISAGRVASSIKDFAGRVITLDVHNPAIQCGYDVAGVAFDNLYSFPVVADYFKKKKMKILEELVIMSPDAGGAQRAEAFAKRLGIEEVVVGYKTRKNLGEVKSLKIMGNVKGKNVLIVDDILDSGGTLLKACEAARKQGAKKVFAYCTHALFTAGTEKVTGCLDLVFVGDTLKREYDNEKIKVISFVPLFAEAIYRINEGESLSALFDEK